MLDLKAMFRTAERVTVGGCRTAKQYGHQETVKDKLWPKSWGEAHFVEAESKVDPRVLCYAPGKRTDGKVSILVIDYDGEQVPMNAGLSAFDGVECVGHTTYRHTPEAPRWRIVLPLASDIEEEDYERVHDVIRGMLDERGIPTDANLRNPAHNVFAPTCPPGAVRESKYQAGERLDVARDILPVAEPRAMKLATHHEKQHTGPIPPASDRMKERAESELRASCAHLAGLEPRHDRNNEACKQGWIIGRYVGAGAIDYDRVYDALVAASEASGHERGAGAIGRGMDKGVEDPKREDEDTTIDDALAIVRIEEERGNAMRALAEAKEAEKRAKWNHNAAEAEVAAGRKRDAEYRLDRIEKQRRMMQASEGKPRGLALGPTGRPVASASNAAILLGSEDIWYDAFGERVQIGKAAIEDWHVSRWIVEWGGKHAIDMGAEKVWHAVVARSRARTRHPVREYLGALPAWDGVDRIGCLASVGFGAAEGYDAAYLHLVGRACTVSAIARVMSDDPVDVHTMCVLQGEQGCGKSMAVEALSPPAFFGRLRPDMSGKDAVLQLSGVWIGEVAEVDASTGRIDKSSEVKSFLSSKMDIIRRPYERTAIAIRRQGIIIGTANPREFLSDPTGARRYLPLRVVEPNPAWIKRSRDQIWAQALAWWREGIAWHPATEHERKLCAEATNEHEREDPLMGALVAALPLMQGTTKTVHEVWQMMALPGALDHSTRTRLGALLTRIGATEGPRVRVGEARVRTYVLP